MLSGITGYVPTLNGPQAVTSDPGAYITYSPDGAPMTHQPLPDGVPAWKPPAGMPPSSIDDGPAHRYNGVRHQQTAGSAQWDALQLSGGVQNMQRGSTVLGLATGGLRGLSTANQSDMNRTYATNVVFQEDPTGGRRAVVQMSQLVATPDNGTQMTQTYGQAGDGKVEMYVPPVSR